MDLGFFLDFTIMYNAALNILRYTWGLDFL